jgi:hypothetical protein
VVSSAWRANDLRSQLLYPNGQMERYTYDHDGRVKGIDDFGVSRADEHHIGEDYFGGG